MNMQTAERKPVCYEGATLAQAREALASWLPAQERAAVEPALTALFAPAAENRPVPDPKAIAHAVGSALIVAELRLGLDAVQAALLFPLAGVRPAALEEFGAAGKLAAAVASMARIEQLARDTALAAGDGHQQMEALRKMVLAMVEDARGIVVKLAERTHALRCAARADEALRRHLGQQARDLFAPLANRLGVWQIKWEMEDWACRYLEGDTYKRIAQLLDEKRADRERYIEAVIGGLKGELESHGLHVEVKGRPKHIASILAKMRRKNLGFEQLYDIRAVRVLVDTVPECYTALGVVHNLWQPIPGEFDDYISHPKSNDYRSLHTAVVGPEGKALEVQIRTLDMHRQAELGVAAHWRYKEGGRHDARLEEKIAWLRRILEWKDDVADASEFAEQFRTELFQDQVYVLTPQGHVIDLPRGATAVDFAYALHTDVGHRCRGARADGVMVPLNTQLATGQRVEILTVKQGGPSRDWLNPNLGYLKTGRARAKVRQWFKQREHGELLALGRSQLDKELKRLGKSDVSQEKLAQALKFKGVEEFLAALGRGDVSQSMLIQALRESGVAAPQAAPPRPLRALPGRHAVVVSGLGEVPATLARCCKPAPPDAVVAYNTVARGLTLHRQNCAALAKLNPERLLSAAWGGELAAAFEVGLELRAFDRQGLLRDVSDALTKERVDVVRVNTESQGEYARMAITFKARDAAQLGRLLQRLARVENVFEVKRA